MNGSDETSPVIYVPVGVAFIIGIVLTISLSYFLSDYNKALEKYRFKEFVEPIHNSIQRELTNRIDVIRTMADLFEVQNSVSRDEFKRFASRTRKKRSPMKVMFWISVGDSLAFDTDQFGKKRTIQSVFTLSQSDTLTERLQREIRDPNVSNNLMEAIESDETEAVFLSDAETSRRGTRYVLVAKPIMYKQNLRGFIGAVFDFHTLLKPVLRRHSKSILGKFELFVHNPGLGRNQYVQYQLNKGETNIVSRFSKRVSFRELARRGRHYESVSATLADIELGLLFVSRSSFENFYRRWSDEILLTAGILLTLFICLYLYRQKHLQAKIAQMARQDDLTGLFNREYWKQRTQEELERFRRYDTSLCLILMDLDNFKKINDNWGHPAGDAVLEHVADLIDENIRDTDIPCRYGGEEFAVLCPETTYDECFQLAERIRNTIENRPVEHQADQITVTVSLGIAENGKETDSLSELLEVADEALYRAKEQGRNKTVRA
ncbi:MAG: GGDEF domain-containing protein [bacterium]